MRKPNEYHVSGSVRQFTPYHPNLKFMDIKLYDTRNNRAVYWSKQGNSYVVVDIPTGNFTAPDGTPCDLVSINGHGEIRWVVSSQYGNTSGDTDAAVYFGLSWFGYRSPVSDPRD